MLFNTTQKNKDANATINDMLGKSYSFFKAVKIGGITSKKMIIEEVSLGFTQVMNIITDINYGHIELREKGIIVHINKALKNYSWAVPYYQLHTYNNFGFSIYAQGNFVRFQNNNMLKQNKLFIDKIIDLKIENDQQYRFY